MPADRQNFLKKVCRVFIFRILLISCRFALLQTSDRWPCFLRFENQWPAEALARQTLTSLRSAKEKAEAKSARHSSSPEKSAKKGKGSKGEKIGPRRTGVRGTTASRVSSMSHDFFVCLMFSQRSSGSNDDYVDEAGGKKLSKTSQDVEDDVEASPARVVRFCTCCSFCFAIDDSYRRVHRPASVLVGLGYPQKYALSSLVLVSLGSQQS